MVTLTDKQQEIYDDIVYNINNKIGRLDAVIEGYAGTGKSTLVSKLIDDLQGSYSIAVTSPTHKANSVLRNMIDSEDISVCTIHSFLGLKLVYKKNRQVLEHDPKSPNSRKFVDILFIDECSMISDNLYKYITEQLYRVRIAIIFIGDSCQLPPVETENLVGQNVQLSKTFSTKKHYFLDEVLRQALDNPIIRLATEIRQCIGTGKNPMDIINRIDDEDTIIRIDDDSTFMDVYIKHISANSVRKLYDNTSNNKIIAYTNYRVDLANMYVRSMMFPNDIDKEFVVGEPIVFESVTQNCPYYVQQMIQCPEFAKESYVGIDCWRMKIPNGDFIYCVGPHSKEKYNQVLEELVDKINNKVINPVTGHAHTWQDYYLIKDKINIINYPYAITAHKSQGSTFENIWFDTNYVDKINDNDTKCRIIYTVLTRPKFFAMLK